MLELLQSADVQSSADASLFSDSQHRRFREVCAEKAERSAHLAALKAARQERGGAMTNAERQRAFVARGSALAEIPDPVNPTERELCRYDFPRWVHRYGGALLKDHMPSGLMIERFLIPLRDSVLFGGQMIVEAPRGKGKTTFSDLLAVWAMSYGHRRFLVLVSATGKLAKINLRNIMKVVVSDAYVADFPEIGIPFKALGGKWQLAESQTYKGVRTGIELRGDRVVFPTLLDAEGNVIGESAGAIVFSGGVGGAIRGLNEGGQRPDMIFFDDIQKRKDAKSPSLSRALEEFVNQDAMGLFGHGDQKTALMAITPICDGDFASLMTDRERNPAWISVIVPLVIEWPSDMSLVDRFLSLYKEDCARDDFARTMSKRFYIEHQSEINAGCVMLDDADGGAGEVDALHHALVLLAMVGREAFDAEYQMRVKEEGVSLTITPDVVKHALNGAPRLVLPPGTETVVGFCDVNARADSGLRYGLLALGVGRVTAFIEVGKYPAGRQPLFPEGLPEVKRPEVIARAVRHVGNMIAALPVRYANGKKAAVSAFAFDGGNWTSAVARAVLILRQVDRVPFMCFWTLGRGWSKYGETSKAKMLRRGDHMYETRSKNGLHVVFHADYWRETMQSLFLSEPLSPGSASLYGSDPVVHDDFAVEVCSERLVRKFVRPDGRLEWNWSLKSKRNHYCDVATGCYVVAAWIRAFDSDAQIIDRAALMSLPPSQTAKRVPVKEGADASWAKSAGGSDDLGKVDFVPAVSLGRKRKTRLRYGFKLGR